MNFKEEIEQSSKQTDGRSKHPKDPIFNICIPLNPAKLPFLITERKTYRQEL